jgi:HK97 family phage prohead protease
MDDFQARAAYADCPYEIRSGVLGDVVGTGFTGYASTTEDPYPVTDWLGEYQETMCRGAFAKALSDANDVRLLVNHEGLPLARTKSGTLLLREDDKGLSVDVPALGNSPRVQDIVEAMQRGDVDQMSFAFKATRQEWNEDYTERFVREVKLYDVSLVTTPANPNATAKLRSAEINLQTLTRGGGTPPEPVIEDEPDYEETARRISQIRALGLIV